MIDKIESVEQDLRQWGQRQMAVLDYDAMQDLRVICDRLNGIRRDLKRELCNTPLQIPTDRG